ncbi:MAG: tRNA dihydrouridine(20/20a) synthase DusA [Parvibaculum sp.]|nr:tRNA dihydrouridine(20/20a) synthase DusA [Parvibaculum sp.]MBO6678732.1 tRNA dihydrouridine(20/20a) synthase DusA [Parvibaculum sp.]MBO6685365.1 tRNA dihydrouridine(20/20a) synthase DusA [Parvibaculum sp.]MBO6905366.1 tRNA dihydrouridine(20/20a) synthase DusA [Parvibaculum sp.]
MMDWTDRHDRYFLRLITRRALLYTEMVTTGAVLHGDRARLLAFSPEEHPVAVQLGGSEPADLAEASRIAEDFGYDEINLNVGCPSDRVQSGRFGACLMREPDLVARCIAAMREAVSVPVTVKCRIGVDEQDPEEALPRMARAVREEGCETLIVHARKAWLEGLSPKENRDVPPLDYSLVYRLKQAMPDMGIIINGGIDSVAAIDAHLARLDGVMLGRAAYQAPWLLSGMDRRYFGDATPVPSRHEVLERFLPYIERELAEGTHLHAMTRHILGIFQGCPGARAFRRHISENAPRPGAGADVVRRAMKLVPELQEETLVEVC